MIAEAVAEFGDEESKIPKGHVLSECLDYVAIGCRATVAGPLAEKSGRMRRKRLLLGRAIAGDLVERLHIHKIANAQSNC
jgi:hypothetical protein